MSSLNPLIPPRRNAPRDAERRITIAIDKFRRKEVEKKIKKKQINLKNEETLQSKPKVALT